MILIDGNVPGCGKGKLGRGLGALATGNLPTLVTEGHSEEEMEKRISAAVLQGSQAILLDNLQRQLNSSTLESILTEVAADIRGFGRLELLKVLCRALVLVTANNASVRADMLRRALRLRIVAETDKPELRSCFDFDPVEEVLRDRQQLLEAAFTVALAWGAGTEPPGEPEAPQAARQLRGLGRPCGRRGVLAHRPEPDRPDRGEQGQQPAGDGRAPAARGIGRVAEGPAGHSWGREALLVRQ
jgi:hypothetical protein